MKTKPFEHLLNKDYLVTIVRDDGVVFASVRYANNSEDGMVTFSVDDGETLTSFPKSRLLRIDLRVKD